MDPTANANVLSEEQMVALSDTELEAEIERMRLEINELVNEKITKVIEMSRVRNEMAVLTTHSEQDNSNSKFHSDFTVHEVLQEGNIASVLSVQSHLDLVTYVIKRITIKESYDIVGKVFREVREIAQLNHPGLMRYHSMWIEQPNDGLQIEEKASSQTTQYRESFIYVQMQLCTYSLENWLEQNQDKYSRPLLRMKTWFKQIVSAIDYLHSKTLVHGNLKPLNILFSEEDVVKVSDMRIRTWHMYHDSPQAKPFGNPEGEDAALYLSPEQRINKNKPKSFISYLNPKSDVFTLGLILAELCAIMSKDEAKEAFDKYRLGRQSSYLCHIPEVEKLVALLTKIKYDERPTCEDILKSSSLDERARTTILYLQRLPTTVEDVVQETPDITPIDLPQSSTPGIFSPISFEPVDESTSYRRPISIRPRTRFDDLESGPTLLRMLEVTPRIRAIERREERMMVRRRSNSADDEDHETE